MRKHLLRWISLMIGAAVLVIWGMYALNCFQYANYPQPTPAELTGTIIEPSQNTLKILASGHEIDNDKLFDLYKLDDYPNAKLELTIEKGSVRVEIENRSEMYGEHYTLGTGESFTADIDELIAKYKYHIGMVVLPLDRKNGTFSLSYQIVQKD